MKSLLSVPASYIKVCKRSDPKLNDCIINSIETLRPYLLKGEWMTENVVGWPVARTRLERTVGGVCS